MNKQQLAERVIAAARKWRMLPPTAGSRSRWQDRKASIALVQAVDAYDAADDALPDGWQPIYIALYGGAPPQPRIERS